MPNDVTGLLLAWRNGDESALNQLIPLVHSELRRIAKRFMAGERGGHTLQATALVNEAYLRLVDVKQVDWQNRAHFLSMSAGDPFLRVHVGARARSNHAAAHRWPTALRSAVATQSHPVFL